jgi:hypothetical protein
MKLPFFSRNKAAKEVSSEEVRIAVFLSDWCPACLEYKVVLNRVISQRTLKIDFLPPSKFNISTIPATLFVKGKAMKLQNGFMTCNKFLQEYNTFCQENE